MDEGEVNTPAEAAFFMANEVVNEYHAFPVVNRADFGGPNVFYVELNEHWFRFDVTEVKSRADIDDLERLG